MRYRDGGVSVVHLAKMKLSTAQAFLKRGGKPHYLPYPFPYPYPYPYPTLPYPTQPYPTLPYQTEA